MITGAVTADREIVVSVEIHREHLSPTAVEAVLDTGFNGYIALPLSVIRASNGQAGGTRRVELGDGNLVDLDVYFVHVSWHGHSREVLALHAETTPLIGMSLLWGSRVQFDCNESGLVTIDESQ